MSDAVIRVEGLGKQYRIGSARRRTNNLREKIQQTLLAPFRSAHGSENGNAQETFWALKDIHFDVGRGEVVGIIGRNGAGKSTLLKILSRITEPTEGEVEIIGRVGSLLEVGTGFHPELTGRENIFLNGAILGMKRSEVAAKFDEIVAFSEGEKFLDTPVKHYSSGMYMRLAFAVAAHLEPEILVVDEVLSVGDAEFQKKCLGRMSTIAGEGRTVLFVSHNMNAVERLCGKVLLLKGGRVLRYSTDVRGIVKDYLYGELDTIHLERWVNPGDEFQNPWFKPTQLFFVDAQGHALTMPVSNATAIWLQIEGEVQEPDPALAVGIAVSSEDGQLLFRSFQTDGPNGQWPVLQRGACALRVKLPPRLLNQGTYKIDLLVSRLHDVWLFCPGRDGPPVYLTIQGGLSDSPLWIDQRPGLLAPVLEWR
jgi:lipopolysaccharide transport system ATP-binding protein